MQAEDEGSIIHHLQDQLKKEHLLLEREQREKVKIKKDIEENIQAYYSVIIEKKGLGSVLKDDNLGNSYNFVKDLVLSLSRDVALGVEILSYSHPNHVEDLAEMLLTLFYDSFTESDPMLKKVAIFGYALAKKIGQSLKKDYERWN